MGREDGSRSCAFGSRCCWLGFAGFALAKNRLALVIGNDAYQHIDALQKARADAKSYADLLREKGFSVTARYDLGFHDM